ncbi:SUKH-3 domain-containing protein [Micromonospora sp. NPDC023966]|uniref:SUKH-3 domain-containing protein n=1 Tax=Micromonospora sp. NPDC023966 TaxID=3154699 RepID=UPI0033CBAAF6
MRILTEAGWQPGRRVDTSAWRTQLEAGGFDMHQAAERFLAEFGGLTVAHRGPGISQARAPFELDPLLCLGEDDRFADWSSVIHRSLFPLGELDEGRFFLGIDETGEVYLVADWLASYGPARQAVEKLILGVAPDTRWDAYPG